MIEELKVTKPEIGRFVEEWQAKYGNKSFDLSNVSGQATFYEAITEMTKHIAVASHAAKVSIAVGSAGVVQLSVNVQSRSPSAS